MAAVMIAATSSRGVVAMPSPAWGPYAPNEAMICSRDGGGLCPLWQQGAGFVNGVQVNEAIAVAEELKGGNVAGRKVIRTKNWPLLPDHRWRGLVPPCTL